jgi:uncharacterized surface protein with fasciclin (FAS1) repeats
MLNVRLIALALLAGAFAMAGAQRAAAEDQTDLYNLKPGYYSVKQGAGETGWPGEQRYFMNNITRPRTNQSILSWLEKEGKYSKFLTALRATTFDTRLGADTGFTVFVPGDAAFDKLPAGVWDALQRPENADLLAQVVDFHIMNTSMTADQMAERETISLSGGESAPFTENDNGYRVANATITTPDLQATNGTVEVIDTVLLPPTVVSKLEGQGYTLTAYELNNGQYGVVMGSTQTRTNMMDNGTMKGDMKDDAGRTGSDVYGKCGGSDNSSSSCGGGGGNNCGCNKCNKCNKCNSCNRCCKRHRKWHINW